MDKEKQIKKMSTKTKVITALGLSAGLAAGIGVANTINNERPEPIYQPDDMQPTQGGTEVPEGFQAPVGESRTSIDIEGSPNQVRIEYGTTPDGQTLPDKIITVPTPEDTESN